MQDEFGRPLLSRMDEGGVSGPAVSSSALAPQGVWLQLEHGHPGNTPVRKGRESFLDDTSASAHYVAFQSIDKVRLWPVASVLHEKYAVFLPEARLVAAALRPAMVLDPTRRAPASALLASPWLGGGGARGRWEETEACPHWGAAAAARHRDWGKAETREEGESVQAAALRRLGTPSSQPPPQGWPRLWGAAELAWRRPQRYSWLVDGAVLCLAPVQRLVTLNVTSAVQCGCSESSGTTPSPTPSAPASVHIGVSSTATGMYRVSFNVRVWRPWFVRTCNREPSAASRDGLWSVGSSVDEVGGTSSVGTPGQDVGFVSSTGWRPSPVWAKSSTVWIPIDEVRACAQCGEAEDLLERW